MTSRHQAPYVQGFTHATRAGTTGCDAVRCWVKSPNERNPCRWLYFSSETAARNAEEGGDDVKSARPLRPGRHTRYNGRDRGLRTREGEPISANPISVQIAGCNPPA